MKKYIYPLALTAAFLATTSCSDDEVNAVDQPIPDSQKEMISFSLSDEASNTRAGFPVATSIAMRIQSNEKGGTDVRYTRTVATADVDATISDISYSEVSFSDSYKRYWDDAFGRKGLLSVYAVAVPNAANTLKNNGVTLEELLAKGDAAAIWGTTATNTIAWKVTTSAQEKDAPSTTPSAPVKNIDLEDLVYSNNIQADATLGKDGIYRWNYTEGKHMPAATGKEGEHKDGRMLFYQQAMTDADAATTAATSAPGHFDKGHLKFKHALSRMTITLIAGEGFTSKPFAFATGTTIKLLNMNVSGTLDIMTGVWSINTTADINKPAKTSSEENATGTYVAQMLPDYTFTDGSNTNVMEFTIDGNTYYITQDMLFDALVYDANGNDSKDTGDGDLVGTTSPIKMEQGKNYNFKITVNKTKIDKITATLAPWVDVTAANKDIDNSHVSFTLTSPTGTNCTDIQFYRLAEGLDQIYTDNSYIAANKGVSYSGDYKTEGAATLTTVNSKYQTNWFYDDNKTAYHFRTINALAADESGTDSDNKSENLSNSSTPAVTTFTMKADATTKDYHWGAPMKSDATFAYSATEGYKSSLYPALIATKSDVNITELHMMSNLNIVLKTTTGNDKVDLSGATITLKQLSTSATVDMGIGLITPTDPSSWAEAAQSTTSPASYWEDEATKDQTKPFTCSVIPQTLVRGTSPADTDYIGLEITTGNGNKYYVTKLSEIKATGIQQGGSNYNDPDHPKDGDNYQAITRWYPNHTYTYTFTLSKVAIENITATVAKWVDVTAADQNINLEN